MSVSISANKESCEKNCPPPGQDRTGHWEMARCDLWGATQSQQTVDRQCFGLPSLSITARYPCSSRLPYHTWCPLPLGGGCAVSLMVPPASLENCRGKPLAEQPISSFHEPRWLLRGFHAGGTSSDSKLKQ